MSRSRSETIPCPAWGSAPARSWTSSSFSRKWRSPPERRPRAGLALIDRKGDGAVRVGRYGILLAVLLVSLLLLTVQTRRVGTGRAGEPVTMSVTRGQSLRA